MVHTPEPVTWGLAVFTELAARIRRRPSLLSLDKAREATAGSWMCSGVKAKDQLGVTFRMGLAERLEQTAEWYRLKDWL